VTGIKSPRHSADSPTLSRSVKALEDDQEWWSRLVAANQTGRDETEMTKTVLRASQSLL
jgi:hypothetical protein